VRTCTCTLDPDDSAAARDRSQYEAQGWSALSDQYNEIARSDTDNLTSRSYYTMVDSREDECAQQITVHTAVAQRRGMCTCFIRDQNDYHRKEAPLGKGVLIDELE
jgi:hypothetical protein